MPYIKQERRAELLLGSDSDEAVGYMRTPGELNYLITRLCNDYLVSAVVPGYSAYNDVIGALECAKQEFYRRIVAPYEDIKIKENGDVY